MVCVVSWDACSGDIDCEASEYLDPGVIFSIPKFPQVFNLEVFNHFFGFFSIISSHFHPRFFFIFVFFFTSRPWFFRVRFHLFWVLSSCFLFFLINHDQKQLPDGGRNFVSSGEEAEKASKEGKGGIPGGCLQVYHHKGGPTIAPLLGFGVATETPLLWLKPFEGVLSS